MSVCRGWLAGIGDRLWKYDGLDLRFPPKLSDSESLISGRLTFPFSPPNIRLLSKTIKYLDRNMSQRRGERSPPLSVSLKEAALKQLCFGCGLDTQRYTNTTKIMITNSY